MKIIVCSKRRNLYNNRCACLFIYFLATLRYAHAEIRTFNSVLEAKSTEVTYATGYLTDPGFVDIKNIKFTPTYDSRTVSNSTDDDSVGNGMTLDESYSQTTVEVILFLNPEECSKSIECDWLDLGIGVVGNDGKTQYCCTESAEEYGLCSGEKKTRVGRLILNDTIFNGEHRTLDIRNGEKSFSIHADSKLKTMGSNGKYTMAFSNCNDNGINVTAEGKFVWMSAHGYLARNLLGEWKFYIALCILHFILFLLYGLGMRINSGSIIDIQKCIFFTISIGFLETFFICGDFWILNEDGNYSKFVKYSWIFLSIVRKGVSRCLLVMVSLGWGVSRDTIGDKLKIIAIIGSVYVIVTVFQKIFTTEYENELYTKNKEEDRGLYDIMTILTFVQAVIDVCFYVWILDSLNATMEYLENMDQTRKLARYLRLRLILLISLIFAIAWAVFGVVDNKMETRILEDGQDWVMDVAWDLNYLAVLCSIAYLWRPDPEAKNYAYNMEIPSCDGDIELDSNMDTIDEEDENEPEYSDSPKIDTAYDA